MAAAIVALVWANVAPDSYEAFWHTETVAGIGAADLHLDLRDLVNDLLMALFFFVVALEVKRELVTGELRDRRTATVPVLAAVGGAVIPAASKATGS